MWYLIIPPIVVVLSLSFVLWYLSRRSTDPSVASEVAKLEMGAVQKVSFSRTKNFFLRILEKIAQRFKVLSLQMHNTLSDVARSLKERRKPFQRKESTDVPSREDRVSQTTVQTTEPSQSSQADSRPMSRFRRRMSREGGAEAEVVSRPMVSEQMVLPEVPYQKTATDIVREEGLIARIAVNPKDFASYEELGDHYLEIGNISDAKECYRQVLKLSPVQRMAKIKIRRLERLLLQKER